MTTRKEENAIGARALRTRLLDNLNGCLEFKLFEISERDAVEAWTKVWEEWIADSLNAIDRARDLEEQAAMIEILNVTPRTGDVVGTCRGCDRPVIWVAITKKDGKPGRLSLDATAPVYQVDGVDRDHGGRLQNAERQKGAYVSHFATCRNANDFSQTTRKKTDD